ncbi:MAG: hypothetical protein E7174_02395 [Firmicutes bacterium]|nr:hypothetical protein [Bacillota bacterium]
MENLKTITEMLRDKIKDEYIHLKEKFYNDINEDNLDQELEDFDDEDLNENYLEDDEDLDIEYLDEDEKFYNEVYAKLMNTIKVSKYKKIIYLILLQDTYECIKSKKISDLELHKYETEMLNLLEGLNLKRLINKIENDEEFYLDLLTIYLEYQFELNNELKQKNKKLLELSNDKIIKKFKIYVLDDVQFQYTKTRKLY